MSNHLRTRKPYAFCLILIVLLSQAALAHGAPDFNESWQTVSSPRPFPPPQYVPSHDYDVRHIALDLRFDWQQEQALGTETIMFSPLVNDLRNIALDAASMSFSSIKLNGKTPLKYEFDEKNQQLRIVLDRAYQPADQIKIVISYQTVRPLIKGLSVNGGGGLNFIKPTPEDPTRPRQIWSQGESEYNHYWFPCFDHPNDFFTSEITATVEKPLSVISNGSLVETKENSDGTRTFHWKIAAPHAAYLTSIIVGEYAQVVGTYDGIPVITNVYPSELEAGKVTAARLPEMVKFFSEKTGVKYPYEKYAQTVARDFNGGMENISATTQYDVMIHDARTDSHRMDSLQSHELAHQWFGDYVTARNWSDIWLNESFATYFQALWDEHSLGHDDFLYLDVKNNQDEYYATWTQGIRRPIVTKNYANPDAVFDTYTYPRGAAVLHMLRQNLGEQNWWRAINYYLTKYAHQPVQTEQFRIAIEEATGQSMDWFFDEWLYKMGHPIFRVTQDYDADAKALKLSVKQEQRPDPNSPYPQVTYFQTPVEIEIGTASGTRIERAQIQPKEEQTFTFQVESVPLLVNFDYGNTLIKELRFEKSADQLSYQLTHDDNVLGRVWALQQLSAKLNNEATTAADKQKVEILLATTLAQDKFWGVRLEAASALSRSRGDAARAALIAATSGDTKSLVRVRAIRALATAKDASLSTVYLQAMNDQSYEVIGEAALALGQTKSSDAYGALIKLIDEQSWHDTIRASGLAGLAALGDKRALELGFKFVAAGNQPAVRAAALSLLGAIGKDDPRTLSLVSDMLKRVLEKGSFTQVRAGIEALVALRDPRAVDVLEDLGKGQTGSSRLRALMVLAAQQLKVTLANAPAAAPPN